MVFKNKGVSLHCIFNNQKLNIMGYRINERNSGNWTLDGEPKRRTKKGNNFTYEEMRLAQAIVAEVAANMKYCPILSEGKGHCNPDAMFDLKDIVFALPQKHIQHLWDFAEKMERLADKEMQKIQIQ